MAERKPLHPEGIDNLRAAVLGRAIADYMDLCRCRRGAIVIPYHLSKEQFMDIRKQYRRYHRDPKAIAGDYHIPIEKARQIGEGLTSRTLTSFIEGKEELKEWFESEDFNMLWCKEPGENITRAIEAKAEKYKKANRKTPQIHTTRKKHKAFNEGMGV